MFFIRNPILPSTCRNILTEWTRGLQSIVAARLELVWNICQSWTCPRGILDTNTWGQPESMETIHDCRTCRRHVTPTRGTRATAQHSLLSQPQHPRMQLRHLILLAVVFTSKTDRCVLLYAPFYFTLTITNHCLSGLKSRSRAEHFFVNHSQLCRQTTCPHRSRYQMKLTSRMRGTYKDIQVIKYLSNIKCLD